MLPIEFSKITKKSPIPLDLIEDKNQRKASFYIKEFKKKISITYFLLFSLAPVLSQKYLSTFIYIAEKVAGRKFCVLNISNC